MAPSFFEFRLQIRRQQQRLSKDRGARITAGEHVVSNNGLKGLFVRSEAKEGRSAPAPGCSMLSRHAGGGQRGARDMVLAARGADRKAAADGMRAIIDESGGAVGWRATVSASWSQQLDLAIAG
jgi:hypothetical protein